MADQDKEHLSGPKPKKWECGDPYQYPVPGEGNHWEQLLIPLLERDREQCESWREEVQNLLIFAGLFSAVVTAFVVLSYQGLQPDQNEIIISLLARISTQLDSSSNATFPSSPSVNPASLADPPTASSIRTNAFWFISLVLSLTTALVSIVSLQWLREHQRYPSTLQPMQKFAMFHMRSEALDAWYVPQIFSALPLLLQLALVLFFVGLIDFLLTSSTKVAVPVIIFIVLPLVFLILTTVIPAFQLFKFCLHPTDFLRRVPQLSPYKSSQSMVFRRITTFSRHIFLFSAKYLGTVFSLLIIPLLRLLRLQKRDELGLGRAEGPRFNDKSKWMSELVFTTLASDSWQAFDKGWLALRDAQAKRLFDGEWDMITSSRLGFKDVGRLYDLTKGLSLSTTGIITATTHRLVYHCVRDLTSNIVGDRPLHYLSFNHRKYNQYLQNLLFSKDPTKQFFSFASLLLNASAAFVQDENAFIVLSRGFFPATSFVRHYAELHIRIMNDLYPAIPREFGRHPSFNFPHYPDRQLRYSYGDSKWRDSLFGAHDGFLDSAISEQFSLVLETFFTTIADQSISKDSLSKSFYAGPIGEMVKSAIIRQEENAIPSMLTLLSTNLTICLDKRLDEKSDFLFLHSAFYAKCLAEYSTKKWPADPLFDNLLLAQERYLKERGAPSEVVREYLGLPEIFDPWWSLLNHSVLKHT